MGKGSTPKATESEKKLGALGNEMKAVADSMTGGREYMIQKASKDTSQRTEERTLGQVQMADSVTVGATPSQAITSYDQRDRAGIGIEARATSDLQAADAASNVAAADLGQSAVASSAESKLGYSEMAINNAQDSLSQTKANIIPEMAGTALGAYMSMGGTGFGKDTTKGVTKTVVPMDGTEGLNDLAPKASQPKLGAFDFIDPLDPQGQRIT